MVVCVTCRTNTCTIADHEHLHLGPRVRIPKKSNKKAWARMASGDIFWDKKHISKRATARARQFASRFGGPRRHEGETS